MDYDVIIIGSGISGACAARELSKYKLRIAVLEKGSDLCAGATKGNSATVHSGHDAAYGTLKAHYNVLGNAMYDKMCAELCVPFIRNGTIVFATTPNEMSELYHLKENADQNKVPNVQLLTRNELFKLEHGWGENVCGALYAPTGGMVCPYSLVFALCENAYANGVNFHLNTKVLSIVKKNGLFLILTNSGEYSTKYIFNCAGTHADEINNYVSNHKIRIIPRKGSHLILDKKLAPYVNATLCQTPSNLPGGGHTKGMGIMPSIDHTIILGCEAREVEDKDDTATTAEGLNDIFDYFEKNWQHFPLSKVYPHFPRHMVIGAFAGLRPHAEGDDFILGEPDDSPGLFNMAGIESPGITAAPAIAFELVSQAAQTYHFKKSVTFSPLRNSKKAFREMSLKEKELAIKQTPNYGTLICRCEQVTKAEILDAIHSPLGAHTVNAVKMRTRAGMGRCQGGFCNPEVVKILSQELHLPMTEITQNGGDSNILVCETCTEE